MPKGTQAQSSNVKNNEVRKKGANNRQDTRREAAAQKRADKENPQQDDIEEIGTEEDRVCCIDIRYVFYTWTSVMLGVFLIKFSLEIYFCFVYSDYLKHPNDYKLHDDHLHQGGDWEDIDGTKKSIIFGSASMTKADYEVMRNMALAESALCAFLVLVMILGIVGAAKKKSTVIMATVVGFATSAIAVFITDMILASFMLKTDQSAPGVGVIVFGVIGLLLEGYAVYIFQKMYWKLKIDELRLAQNR